MSLFSLQKDSLRSCKALILLLIGLSVWAAWGSVPANAQTSDTEIRFHTSLSPGSKLRIYTEPYNQATVEGLRKGDFLGEYFVETANTEVVIRGKVSILELFKNQITDFQIVSAPDLVNLKIYDNQISTIDLKNAPKINYLDCHNNQIKALDLSGNTSLERLFCQNNHLETLAIEACTQLVRVECGDNRLSQINLQKALLLEDFYFQNNQISQLDLSQNTKLWGIKMYGNLFDSAKMKAFIATLPLAYANPAYLWVVDSRNLSEKNQCSMQDVAEMQKKGWAPYDYFGGSENGVPFLGDDYQPEVGSQRMEITFAKAIGETISIEAQPANGNILIEGVQEKAPFQGKMTLTLKEPTIVIRGALKSLNCQGNQVTQLSDEGNDLLETLDCSNNQIRILDLKNHPTLKTLSCQKNRIEKLDLTGCTQLTRVNAYLNRLMAENMTRFVESLYTKSGSGLDPLLFLIDTQSSSAQEENVALKSDIDLAKSKSWRIKDYINGGMWGMGKDYSGTAPTYHTLTITPSEYGTLRAKGVEDLTHILHGQEIVLEAQPLPGYELSQLIVNGEEIPAYETFLLTQDTQVEGIFTPQTLKPDTYITLERPDKGLMSVSLTVDGDKTVAPIVEGATIKGWNGEQLTLDTDGQPITIYGQFTEVKLYLTFITKADVSHMPMLAVLACGMNRLKELSLENNTALEILSCEANGLEKLTLPTTSKLYFINAYGNKLQGESMDQLIDQLPDRKGQKVCQLIIYDSTYKENENNQCLQRHVQAAHEKNWKTFDLNGDPNNMIEYQGYDTHIQDIEETMITIYPNPSSDQVTITNAPSNSLVEIWNISGEKVHATHTNASGEASIACNQWPGGIYWVTIERVPYSTKIIKR